jgi:hypothetical protein
MTVATAVWALEDLVRGQGGLLAGAVAPAAGDAAAAVDADLAVAAIREGHDVHYAGAGAVVAPADPDLGLLAGDALYALGLERLAERGDLPAIRLLADVIADCARAHAEGRPGDADAAWAQASRQLGTSGHPTVRSSSSS